MAAYSPGEIANFYFVPETVFGTTPTDALTWGGIITEKDGAKPKVNQNKQFHRGSTSRSFSDVTKGAWNVGFKLKALARVTSGGYNWKNFWAVYALGSATALTEHLGSFTAQLERVIGASKVYWHFNGCKINKLAIACEGPGQLIEFDADILARWPNAGTAKAITGLQALTVGDDPAEITTALMTWASVSQINIAAGGLVNWYPRAWQINIDNGLKATMGNLTGADANNYPCAQSINEGGRDILFSCTLDLENETYNTAKLAGSAITALTFIFDTFTVTLSNGELVVEDDDLPPFHREIGEQTLRIRFKSIAVSA
jgi:hypothetical protein